MFAVRPTAPGRTARALCRLPKARRRSGLVRPNVYARRDGDVNLFAVAEKRDCVGWPRWAFDEINKAL